MRVYKYKFDKLLLNFSASYFPFTRKWNYSNISFLLIIPEMAMAFGVLYSQNGARCVLVCLFHLQRSLEFCAWEQKQKMK